MYKNRWIETGVICANSFVFSLRITYLNLPLHNSGLHGIILKISLVFANVNFKSYVILLFK
jgi:hypothetical protein